MDKESDEGEEEKKKAKKEVSVHQERVARYVDS